MKIKINTQKRDVYTKIDKKDLPKIQGKKLWLTKKHVKLLASPGNEQLLHRYLLKPSRDKVVDHINGDPLDNRRSNLRICDQAENVRNKTIQRNNTSSVPSVEWQKDASMWRVRPKYLGSKIHIGYFKSFEEAAYVRDQVIMQLHGDFARTYVIDSKGSDFASCSVPSWER